MKFEFQSDQSGRSSILSAEMLGAAAAARVNGRQHFITLVLSEHGLLSNWGIGNAQGPAS